MPITEAETIQMIKILEQEERERVSPKLEAIKISDKNIFIVQGGRAAGAKSWGFASLIIQMCNYERHRVVCLREVQKSLEESVHQLIGDTIERLQYRNWVIRDDYIENRQTKSHIIFRGLKDLRASQQAKGLEGYDVMWEEEASTISNESHQIIMPTLVRNPWWRLFISYNPDTDHDPCTLRFWNSDRPDTMKIRVEPGLSDNPWWSDGLQKEMEMDFARNPDEALHVWGGQPRKQGQNAVMSRVSIMAAMRRQIQAIGAVEIGIDVARFGDDKTTMYKRRGLKVIADRCFQGYDTTRVADEAWELAGRDTSILMKIDSGYNPGVIDVLRKKGAKVLEIAFGGSAMDTQKYDTAADEMWFDFPVDEAQIPNDNELQQELAGRLYDFDNKGRRKIESKKEYKKRFGKSPDKADGLLLCFYRGNRMLINAGAASEMAARRAGGK
jgi:phage terminase large subunit